LWWPDYLSCATFCPAFTGMNSPRFLSPVTEPTRRGQPRERLVANQELAEFVASPCLLRTRTSALLAIPFSAFCHLPSTFF